MRLLRSVLRYIFRKLRSAVAEPGETCWEKYRDYVRIHPLAIIAPTAAIKIFNPPNPPRVCLEVGEGSHIFSTFNLLRAESTIRIGKHSQLGASNFICSDKIDVGDDVLMAWGCTIMDNDSHALNWNERKNDVRDCYRDYLADPENFIMRKDWTRVPMKPIKIGNRCWIGFGASLLKGVTIGDGAVVGAQSVVTGTVPNDSVVAGNPARVVKKVNLDHEAH